MHRAFRLTAVVIGLGLILYTLFFMDIQNKAFYVTGSGSAMADASELTGKKSELAHIRLLTECVGLVRRFYISHSMIDPKKMLISSLKAVENLVPEVMIKTQGEPPQSLMVRVGYEKRDFNIAKIKDLYEMNWRLLDIFHFIASKLPNDVDTEDIESTAINGMLKTLDEHTVFLPPKAYAEMKLDTRGQFGGLGIVITIRKGYITVMSVIPGTPAAKAMLKSNDQIVQIKDETTLNMPLIDAVTRLRGKPGTKVTIYVKRQGWSAPKVFHVTREIIHVRSVESKYLGDHIGYVSLKRFQENSADELRQYINKLKDKHDIKGLVLDLRQDPGGLLDQAVECARLFINKGQIVTTTEVADTDGETYEALGDAPFAKLPLVVLVDGGSASAAEILTVALKRNNRALVVGNRTFGKGTVQVMREVGEGALKITIGQYLGPGRVSIQGVGIMPHIELVPVDVSKKSIHLLNPDDQPKVKSYYKLKAMGPIEVYKPLFVMNYFKPEIVRENIDDDENPFPPKEDSDPAKDFEVRLAGRMLIKGGDSRANLFFKKAMPVLQKTAQEQDKLVMQQFTKTGKNWSDGQMPANMHLKAFVTAIPKDGAKAGASVTVFIAVANRSNKPIFRVHGVTQSDEPVLDGQEFAIGMIPVNRTGRTKLTIKVPSMVNSSLNRVKFKFYSDSKVIKTKTETMVRFRALHRPRFAYAFQVQDRGGNGNGLAEPGETFDLVFDITNLGDGPAKKLLATLQNKSGHGVLVRAGRKTLKHGLGVGMTRQMKFRVSLTRDFKDSTLKLALGITDLKLRTFLSENLNIPVYKPLERRVKPLDTAVEVISPNILIYPGADKSLSPLYTVEQGAFLKVVGSLGAFYKISMEDGRFGFIGASKVRRVKGVVRFTELPAHPGYARVQPAIYVPNIKELLSAPLENKAIVKGKAIFYGPGKGSRKVFAFVGNEKVFFHMLSKEDNKSRQEYQFKFPVELKKDSETIRVFALEGKSNVNTGTVNVIKIKVKQAKR